VKSFSKLFDLLSANFTPLKYKPPDFRKLNSLITFSRRMRNGMIMIMMNTESIAK